jgi:hypothetical protein
MTVGRGRKSAGNWTGIVDLELRHLRSIGSPLLENFEELCVHLEQHLESETKQKPKSQKRFRRRIRDFIEVQN